LNKVVDKTHRSDKIRDMTEVPDENTEGYWEHINAEIDARKEQEYLKEKEKKVVDKNSDLR